MSKVFLLLISLSLFLACDHRALSPEDAGADRAVLHDTHIPADRPAPPVQRDGPLLDRPSSDIEPTTDPQVLKCLASFRDGCECMGACEDGWGRTVWYPSDADVPFPGGMSPSEQLLEVAVANTFCSVCEACEQSWEITREGAWHYVTAEQMCEHIVAVDRACGGCLETWWGGAG